MIVPPFTENTRNMLAMVMAYMHEYNLDRFTLERGGLEEAMKPVAAGGVDCVDLRGRVVEIPAPPEPAGEEYNSASLVKAAETLFLGACFAESVTSLRKLAAEWHSRGQSYFLPDGDGQTAIRPGTRFPAHGYIQHNSENVWALSRLVDGIEDKQAGNAVRGRLLCIDRFCREYDTPATAALEVKRGYICLESRV
jgi:hypothetical protein